VHHVYGAIVFETPWRLHIVFIALPVGVLFTGLFVSAYRRRGTAAGRWLKWAGAGVILVFCVALIGIYEGGYNHLLANIVFLTHGPDTTAAIYDMAVHEMPTEPVFETTGIAQFVAGIGAAWTTFRLLAHPST
jgi:hypothetical protein